MLSRTLRLAAMAILTAFAFVLPARGQNLDAGKTPAQIFGNTCNACHKSARGLLRSVAPGSLPGFLRQHYTTSTDMAKTLSGYLLANGATDAPRVANVPTNRQGRPDAAPGNPQGAVPAPGPEGAKQGRRPQQDAAARPDADGLNPPAEPKPPRGAKQAARTPDGAPDSPPAQPGPPKGPPKNAKRGAQPPAEAASAQPAAVAATALSGEAAIVAAVPVPEAADLPPPTVSDFKIDPPKPVAKPDAASAAPPAQAAAVSPPPAPARTSSASLASKPAGPPPSPPISH